MFEMVPNAYNYMVICFHFCFQFIRDTCCGDWIGQQQMALGNTS